MAHDTILSGWDIALLMAPFSVMLFAWMFRLDVLLASPKARRRRHVFSLKETRGCTTLTDPDGRPWRTVRRGAHGPGTQKSAAVENFGPGEQRRAPLLPISRYKVF